MFKSKNTRVKQYIEIIHGTDHRHSLYKRGELPIKEEIILEKSIQFFNDPEPCYIHRGAIHMRVNEEVMEVVEQYDAHKLIVCDEEGLGCKQWIDLEEVYALAWFEV